MELNTLELQRDLHSLVSNTNDENVLLRVKDYFTELKKQENWWNLLSTAQKNNVEIGTMQLDIGQKFSHKEVRNEIDK